MSFANWLLRRSGSRDFQIRNIWKNLKSEFQFTLILSAKW